MNPAIMRSRVRRMLKFGCVAKQGTDPSVRDPKLPLAYQSGFTGGASVLERAGDLVSWL